MAPINTFFKALQDANHTAAIEELSPLPPEEWPRAVSGWCISAAKAGDDPRACELYKLYRLAVDSSQPSHANDDQRANALACAARCLYRQLPEGTKVDQCVSLAPYKTERKFQFGLTAFRTEILTDLAAYWVSGEDARVVSEIEGFFMSVVEHCGSEARAIVDKVLREATKKIARRERLVRLASGFVDRQSAEANRGPAATLMIGLLRSLSGSDLHALMPILNTFPLDPAACEWCVNPADSFYEAVRNAAEGYRALHDAMAGLFTIEALSKRGTRINVGRLVFLCPDQAELWIDVLTHDAETPEARMKFFNDVSAELDRAVLKWFRGYAPKTRAKFSLRLKVFRCPVGAEEDQQVCTFDYPVPESPLVAA